MVRSTPPGYHFEYGSGLRGGEIIFEWFRYKIYFLAIFDKKKRCAMFFKYPPALRRISESFLGRTSDDFYASMDFVICSKDCASGL